MQAGGTPLAIKTVASYTGLPVNHVITVDFTRFKDVIDALGGITVNVPERIVSKFDCPLKAAQCAHWKGWRFARGEQHMSGRRALIYSRVRKNLLNPGDTDISRTEHQQDVLQAVLRKMTSISSLAKMPLDGSKLVRPLATDPVKQLVPNIRWKTRFAPVKCILNARFDIWGTPLQIQGIEEDPFNKSTATPS